MSGERGLVFVGQKGAPLRRSNFRPIWNAATEKAGIPGLHFHDLRHWDPVQQLRRRWGERLITSPEGHPQEARS